MISKIDKLLLSSGEQEELEKANQAYLKAKAAGDQQGKAEAHAQAEKIRARAGYSGGSDGSSYTLLTSSGAPEGYSGYEALVQRYAGNEMNAIASDYDQTVTSLQQEREKLKQQGEENQRAARSSVWNQQRLASNGLLTRGLENTGLADVLTSTALNQASANAYQALLEQQERLAENDADQREARSNSLSQAADLQGRLAELLGESYLSLLEEEQDRQQEIDLQKIKQDASASSKKQDYYYQLALQQLKRQWELEDQAKGL